MNVRKCTKKKVDYAKIDSTAEMDSNRVINVNIANMEAFNKKRDRKR